MELTPINEKQYLVFKTNQNKKVGLDGDYALIYVSAAYCDEERTNYGVGFDFDTATENAEPADNDAAKLAKEVYPKWKELHRKN